jgi:ornithine--oxo-acid transaminase
MRLRAHPLAYSAPPVAMDHDNQPTDPLRVVADATARAGETLDLAARHLDPSLVDVLRILGFDKQYASARGSHLYDRSGRAYLDFHTGEGFASLGHNHPDVRAVLKATLDADLVDGVQIHYSALAGILAESLAERLPPGLDAVFFASAGAEAVDSAMKFARAATGRPRLLSCDSGFHGVGLGPLSLVGDDFFKEGFGPLLPGCQTVPFGDLDRLEAQLRKKDVAAFLVEPIQGRTVSLPPDGYLRAAQDLCRRYDTLFVVDEIQTGLGRTGKWFALEHWGLQPDFVLVGKALSGGYMPVAAMATTREVFQKAVGTLERSYVHQSTFGRNRLSMAAGLATLRIIERDRLVERSATVGETLLYGLAELRQRYEMVTEVRGRGLMIGIELGAPRSRVARANWRLIHLASGGLFPQLIVIPLHRDHGVITMAAGKNDVIKLLPPLTLSESEAGAFLTALDAVLADCHGAASKNWGMVRDIATATLTRRRASPHVAVAERPFRGKPVDPTRDDACLITGATGFIGGHLAERMLREGHQVRCLVRASSDTSLLDELDVEIAVGDLNDARSLARAAEGCRYVFHCGALVSDWATTEELERINVIGTRNLLDASVAASVQRFIHFSTTDVYGHPGGTPVGESYACVRFANWYAETKLHGEAEVRRAERGHALEAVILRPATVYGPRSTDVVGDIARAIRAGHMLLVDRGRANAGLCYVDNLMDAAVLALCHDAAPGQAFNVSDGLDVTWKQFTDGLAHGLGCSEVRWSIPYWMASGIGLSLEQGYRALRRTTRLSMPALLSRQAVQVLGRNQDFSTRKARELLGWEPRIGYDAGLEATVAWLRTEYLAR